MNQQFSGVVPVGIAPMAYGRNTSAGSVGV